ISTCPVGPCYGWRRSEVHPQSCHGNGGRQYTVRLRPPETSRDRPMVSAQTNTSCLKLRLRPLSETNQPKVDKAVRDRANPNFWCPPGVLARNSTFTSE